MFSAGRSLARWHFSDLQVFPRLEIRKRKLDLFWVALSIGLAVFTWTHAIRAPYAPIWLYIILNIQSAVVFAIRQPARITSKRLFEVLVTICSVIYIFAFDPVPTSSETRALIGGTLSALGAIMAIASIQCLGCSFAILPSLRAVRTRACTASYGILSIWPIS